MTESVAVSKKQGVFSWFLAHPIMSFVLAVSAIAIPLLWDYSKTTTSLDLRIVEAVQLVNEETFESGFTVNHKGNVLDGLARVTLLFVNTGNSAISKELIVKEPVVAFPASVNVLAAQVPASDLNKLSSAPAIEQFNVRIPVSLLNPGETITLNIYADCEIDDLINPSTESRVKYLNDIAVHNLVDQVEAAGIRAAKARIPKFNWDTIPSGLLAVFMGFSAFVLRSNLREQKAFQKKIRENPEFLNEFSTREQLEEFVKTELPKPLQEDIRIRRNTNVSDARSKIEDAIQSRNRFYRFVASVVICLGCLVYIAYHLWLYIPMKLNGY